MSKQQKDTDTLGQADHDDDEDDFAMIPRIDMLKKRARELGINHSPNIGEATLAKKIEDHLEGTQGLYDSEGEDDHEESASKLPKLSEAELKVLARKRAQLLVRVNITPIDPRRMQLHGELILSGNGQVGTIAKYIPFNTPRGYMVPQVILDVMREREFTHFKMTKDEYGNPVPEPVQRRAFNIEIMKPLTQKQIDKIAERQRAAAKWDEENNSEVDTFADDED